MTRAHGPATELLERSERVLGLRLCFHDRSIPRGFPKRWCEHADPACLAVKQSHQRQCCAWCGLHLENAMAADPRPRIQTCPFGHTEIVAPVRRAAVPGVLYAGPVWTGAGPAPRPQLRREPEPGFLADRLGMVAALARALGETLSGAENVVDDRRDTIIAFIHRQRQQIPRLSDLAADLGLSVSRTGHLVRELFAMPFAELAHEIKLREAAHYLANSGMPILGIALHFGYSDQSHFTRRFRARYGRTPRAYRLRHASRTSV